MSAATMNEMDRLVSVNREQADRIAELEQWQRDMVAKAAEQSLGGYREIGQRAAKAESERDEAFAKGKQVFEDLRRVEAERDALAAHLHQLDDVCRHLSRHCEDKHWGRMHDLLAGGPTAHTTSLARLKAEWQAEALQQLADDYYGEINPRTVADRAANLRRQAEESTNGHH